MQSCVFCNAPLQPGQAFCGSCGQMQPQASADAQTTLPTGDALSPPPAPASGPAPYMPPGGPPGGPPAAPGDLYAPTIRSAGSGPGVSDSSMATQPEAPVPSPPPPPPVAPWTPPGAPSGSWGQTQPGAPGMPSGAWTPSPSGPGNVPVAPGWQPTGSQPWQQPTVGWQPPGSQPWQPGGSQPWQAPGSQPWQPAPVMPPPGTAGGKTNGKKIALIIGGVLAAVIVLVAAAGLFFILTQPNPSLTITSATSTGSTPTGSPDKVFHIQGQKFSHNEAITLLLDGNKAPGAPGVSSDGSGAFTLDLTITDDWLVGAHQITARDTSGYVTKAPVHVQIVAAPVIDVQSQYQSGSTPAGAAGTSFHVTGKRFPTRAPITFMLDGKPVPGASSAQSDDHGKVDTQFSVTGDWALGAHTLTAQDAQGDSTQQSAPVVIVHPGEAGTPGPNGAPADNANFSLSVSIKGTTTDGQTVNYTDSLQVTGHSDPAGGTVCGVDDDGQPHTFTNEQLTGTNLTITETVTFSCSGSYKSGHLTYTETATSDKMVLSDGSVCVSPGAYVYAQLDGTFSDQSTISGSYHRDYFQANCSSGRYVDIYRNPASGTWTGGEY